MSTVDYLNTEYANQIESWKTMEDALSSESNVHKQTTTYLPKLDDMTDSQYNAYIKRASFPMFTKHVLTTFVGMALRKDIMLNSIPDDIANNVDGAGTTLTAYTKQLLDEFMAYGRAVTFVDYSNTQTNSTSTHKPRAKLLLYDHLSLINWRTRIIDEVETLSLMVLRESVNISEDIFVTELRYRYRVLSLDEETNEYRQQIYDHDGNEDIKQNIVPTKDRKPLNFIPAIIHGGTDVKEPPLLSLAEQNFAWYRIDADYKHGLHYVALPTPVLTGVDPEDKHAPKSIGPTKLWFLPDGATAKYLEFTGAGLDQVKEAKDDTAESIITLSSRILTPTGSGNETATAATIRNAGETASLSDIVRMLSSELTLALEYAINWDRITDAPTVNNEETDNSIGVEINTDFIPTILSGGDVASYVASKLKGGLSSKSLFKVLKQGEIHDGNRKYEDEQADIKKEMQNEDDRVVELARRVAEAEAEGTAEGTPEPPAGQDPNNLNDNPDNEPQDKDSTIKQGKDNTQDNTSQDSQNKKEN